MYIIPDILKTEIEDFSQQITDFKNGIIEAVKFKAIRVPMGIYEQRNNGTFMVRIRCAAGMITPQQLIGVAQLAKQYGTEPIHLTTRQELQVHNVKLEQTYKILAGLFDLGLSSRGGGGNTVRNIMASEDAGISIDEQFDVTPYALALTNTLIAEKDSWSLPRKYKIAFSGNDTDNANAIFNDLGFIATVRNEEKGFKVFLGGGLGAKPSAGHLLFDFLPASDILYVGEAVKALFSEHGNRRNRHKARLRYLVYKLGKEKVFELFHNYFHQLKRDNNYPLNLPQIPVSTKKGSTQEHTAENSTFNSWTKRYVKAQKHVGLYAVEVPFEHGMTDSSTLSELAKFLSPFGSDCLRLTMRQNILLRNIPGNQLPELFQLLNSLGVETETPRLLNSLVACTGADTCRLGICLAKGASSAIKTTLSQLDEAKLDKLFDFRINLSGCPNSCGQHNVAQLGFYGKASRNDRLYPAYYVTIGGQTGIGKEKLGERIGEISARDIPAFTSKVIDAYTTKIDNYSDFDSYAQAEGKTVIKNFLKEYKVIPSFDDDKNYYFDWGGQELFSINRKGVGECSAGMFDMIDFDRDAILEFKKKLVQSSTEESINQVLYKMIFHASRMLLVTRGIEPKSKEKVFSLFIEAFINEGYVAAHFKNVVHLALLYPKGNLAEHRQVVLELASSVIDLYNSMDDSLQFKVSQEKPKTEETVYEKTEKRFKDFRGVACPMNFVKTKIELAQMNTGELLEIFLDDGAPINNVPGSVRSEGHEIIKQEKINDHWLVVIKK